MKYTDPVTGLLISDLSTPLLTGLPSHDQVLQGFSPLILSASGWRKVFAASGQEEDACGDLSDADKVLAAGMAFVYAGFLKKATGKSSPLVVLGLDSRPTGPVFGEVMARVFLGLGLRVEYLFIVAAPEIMAYTKVSPEADGFAYVSASHNPVGHNGVKFGLGTGGVLSGAEGSPLIQEYRNLIQTGLWQSLLPPLLAQDSEILPLWKRCLEEVPQGKKRAEEAYRNFSLEVITGLPEAQARGLWDQWKTQFSSRRLGIVSEFNGSARCLSIDSRFLQELGIKNIRLNDRPRQFVHRIVPEGESLNLCRDEVKKAWKEDQSFLFGYVPDCDGDRGNLVYLDEACGEARILEAQEVFALAVLGELTYQKWLEVRGLEPAGPLAVAVNDATSQRIEEIARILGAETHRCEVGEANVVGRAQELRAQGYKVRVLGEGSNGGNIVHPAAVRDPLNTLFSLIKLMNLRSDSQGPGLFELWCSASHQEYNPDFSLQDVLKTLPAFVTTSAYEPEALLKISSTDHARLKSRYEELFLTQWEERQEELRTRWNIAQFRQINYEGTKAKEGWGPQFRSGAQRGGFKIEFLDDQGQFVAANWMRGSGTEPVFRILTDVKGNSPDLERHLREWHTALVLQADR